MASALDILSSPDYINANPATKEAIFNKRIASTPDFANANPATQSAIRQKFGLDATAARGTALGEEPAGDMERRGFVNKPSLTLAPQVRARVSGAALAPSTDVGGLKGVGEAALGLGRGVLKGFGGLGDIGGSAIGLPTSEEVSQVFGLEETPPQYAAYENIGGILGPGGIAKGINVGGKFKEKVGEKIVDYTGILTDRAAGNKLIKLLGKDAAAAVNELAKSKTGVESAGEALAGMGNVQFSQYLKSLETAAPQTYADLVVAKKSLLGTQAGRVEQTVAKAEKEVTDSLANPKQTDVGTNIVNAAKKEREAVKKDIIRPGYDAAFKAAGDTKIDVSQVVDDAENILGSKLADIATKDMPQTVEALAKLRSSGPKLIAPTGEVIAQPKVQATLEQIDKVRKAINDDIAAAQLGAGTPNAARLANLKEIHASIDKAVADSGTLDDMAKALYKTALDNYRNLYVPRFKTGESAKLFERRSRNMPGVNPEDVAGSFLRGESEAKSFVDLFQGNKAALDEAKTGIEGLYRKATVNADGSFNQTAHTAFLEQYGPQIDILDDAGMGLRNKFTSVAGKAQTVTAPLEGVKEVKAIAGKATLPEGARLAKIESSVNDLLKVVPDTDIQNYVEVARRATTYEDLARGIAPGELNLPFTNPLDVKQRVAAKVFEDLMKKLNATQRTKFAEIFADPQATRVFLAKALERQKTGGPGATRRAARQDFFNKLGVVNALAPPNQNALAEQ